MENKFQKMLEQASDLAEDQEYEEALLLYDKILESDPKHIPALFCLLYTSDAADE